MSINTTIETLPLSRYRSKAERLRYRKDAPYIYEKPFRAQTTGVWPAHTDYRWMNMEVKD